MSGEFKKADGQGGEGGGSNTDFVRGNWVREVEYLDVPARSSDR